MKNDDKNEDAVFPWVVCYFRGVQHNTSISTALNVFINKLYCERVWQIFRKHHPADSLVLNKKN